MKKLYLFVLIGTLYITNTYARWANYEDASIEVEFAKVDIIINKDGTYDYIFESKEKILKESGREHAASYKEYYNSNSSTMEIIEAKTINKDGKEYVVTKNMIEDKPLASCGYGFDDTNQVLISFPNPEVGASIYIKYKEKVNKVLIDNFFSTVLGFYDDKYYKHVETNVKSAIPLYMKVNDPRNVLKVTKTTKEGFDNINITTVKPIFEQVVDEPRNIVVNANRFAWVSLSSTDKWKDLGSAHSAQWEKVLTQPLPPLFEDIAKVASEKITDKDIINTVTSMLNEKVQYMGDWRTIEGKAIPRDLAKVASTQVGDCKDFTAGTIVILRKLGFKAVPADVKRGTYYWPSVDILPGWSISNHAIVKVTSKDGVIYWIDPTNRVSMAGGLFSDIAGKKALVSDGEESNLEQIPSIDPNHSLKVTTNDVIIKDNKGIITSGTVKLIGERAANIVGLGLYYSESQLKDMAYEWFADTKLEQDQKKEMVLPDLKARVSGDLTIKYKFEQSNRLSKTNLGSAFSLGPYNSLKDVVNSSPNQVGDLLIGPQFTSKKHTHIKNVKIKKPENLNYKITTPWVNVTRSCTYNKKDRVAQIDEEISILKNFITKEDLQSQEYKNLKNSLEENFINSSMVIH